MRSETWDQSFPDRLRRAGRPRSARMVLRVVLVVVAGVAFLPSVATAHDWEYPGFNGAQISVDPDRSNFPYSVSGVAGKGFVPNDLAHIFQCPDTADDLRTDCQLARTVPTDATGSFTRQQIPVSKDIVTANGPVSCRTMGPTQCIIAASTYDPVGLEATSEARHLLCFRLQQPFPSVDSCEVSDAPTTTTTTPPPEPEWEPAAPMAEARRSLATTVGGDGHIYALGGIGANGSVLSSAERFDPCRKTWSSLPPMSTPRTDFGAAGGADGRIYAIGGYDGSGKPLATVEAYDPALDAWSTVARLAVPRSELAASLGPDGRIYAMGGQVGSGVTDYNGGAAVSMVEVYDATTDTWAVGAPLSSTRARLEAITGPDGRMYAVGGLKDTSVLSSPALSKLEYFTPGPSGTPGTWQPVEGSLLGGSSLSRDFAVATGANGLIYATGGYDLYRGARRIIDIYDPTTRAWTASREALTTPRYGHGSAAGPDGRVYAIGGSDYAANDDPNAEDGPQPLSSVESLKLGPNNCPRLTPPTDFDGDGDTEVSVFRPSTGTWLAKDGATSAWGAEGDIPVPGDYDGDRITDVAIFRPSVGLWAIDGSAGVDTFVTYGIATDVPVPADYDGDGKTDIAVYRPDYATWWVHQSSDGADIARTFGLPTDVPVPGDYDGDGSADLGIFRDGSWFVQPASGGAYTATTYGIGSDVPVPGDYDGDHTTDMAVFRPSDGTWALHRSSDGADEVFGFGSSGDVPVTGDYNADRIADPAVFRPSTGEWFIETGETHSWGTGTDIPLPLPAAVRLAFFA